MLVVKGGRVFVVKNPIVMQHYGTSLRRAADDFVARAGMNEPTTPEEILALVELASVSPSMALILAVDDQWKLLGFGIMVRVENFTGGHATAEVPVVYMRPDRPARHVSEAFNKLLDSVASEWGCERLMMISTRERERAWKHYGYAPAGVVYTKELRSGTEQSSVGN